jgi:hypothetical protein
MTSDRENMETDLAPEVANIGFVRPPLVYLSAIVLGLLLHFRWPVPFMPDAVAMPVGVIIAIIAIALFVYAVRTFRTAGTPLPGNHPPRGLCARDRISGAAIRSTYLSHCSSAESHAGSTVSGYLSLSFQR